MQSLCNVMLTSNRMGEMTNIVVLRCLHTSL